MPTAGVHNKQAKPLRCSSGRAFMPAACTVMIINTYASICNNFVDHSPRPALLGKQYSGTVVLNLFGTFVLKFYICIMARNKAFDPEERLEKARDLFWEKGYNATSMQDLVEGMQLNRASIYDTYGDKYALFQQCLQNYAKEKLFDYKQCCDKVSPMTAVESIVRRAVSNKKEGKTCLMVKTSFELASMDDGIKMIVQEQAKASISVLQELLEKAKQMNEIPAEKDPATLAQFLYASFSSLWMMDVLFGDREMLERMADHILYSIRH